MTFKIVNKIVESKPVCEICEDKKKILVGSKYQPCPACLEYVLEGKANFNNMTMEDYFTSFILQEVHKPEYDTENCEIKDIRVEDKDIVVFVVHKPTKTSWKCLLFNEGNDLKILAKLGGAFYNEDLDFTGKVQMDVEQLYHKLEELCKFLYKKHQENAKRYQVGKINIKESKYTEYDEYLLYEVVPRLIHSGKFADWSVEIYVPAGVNKVGYNTFVKDSFSMPAYYRAINGKTSVEIEFTRKEPESSLGIYRIELSVIDGNKCLLNGGDMFSAIEIDDIVSLVKDVEIDSNKLADAIYNFIIEGDKKIEGMPLTEKFQRITDKKNSKFIR